MSQINSQEANAIRVKIETSSVKNYLYCIIECERHSVGFIISCWERGWDWKGNRDREGTIEVGKEEKIRKGKEAAKSVNN